MYSGNISIGEHNNIPTTKKKNKQLHKLYVFFIFFFLISRLSIKLFHKRTKRTWLLNTKLYIEKKVKLFFHTIKNNKNNYSEKLKQK